VPDIVHQSNVTSILSEPTAGQHQNQRDDGGS
jgi:hypothetical protein